MADMLIDGSPMRMPEAAAETRRDLGAPASVVNDHIAPSPARHLPHMLIATTLVAVLPLAVSLVLRASGLISGWLSVGLAVTMSLASSALGSAYWRKRGGHGEVLFSELLLWGWIRSWRQERELANATRLLDLVNPDPTRIDEPGALTVERREHLLRQLAGALEGQDVYLNGHSRRVARHATMIARGMGMSNEDVARIRAAAAVHDVGKLRTPKAVLNKPGRLTDEEFDVIKRHPVDGAEMVAALGDPELTRIVRHHHERLDGAGYPDRLREAEIPLGARVIAVADTFDAITSARPYRDAAPHQKAIDILRKEAGTQLDPEAVRAFLAYYSGNRPTVVWAIITSSLRRIVAWLTGDPAAAATISAGKMAAATVATAAIGAAAATAPVPVVHHPSRPAVAHSVRSRPRRASAGLRRQGTSVIVSAVSASARATSAAQPRSATPVKSHRRAAHATGKHSHAQPRARRAHSRPARRHGAPAGTGTTMAVTQGPAPSSHARTGAQGGAPHTTSAPVAPKPSHPAPVIHSHGSTANGNAYGHTKPLGNGHGHGVAAGHTNPNPSPRPPSHTDAAANGGAHANANANVPAAVPTTPAAQGSASTQPTGNGNSQGGGNSQGNVQDNATAPAGSSSTWSGSDGQGDQGDHHDHGSGDHGHGHDG